MKNTETTTPMASYVACCSKMCICVSNMRRLHSGKMPWTMVSKDAIRCQRKQSANCRYETANVVKNRKELSVGRVRGVGS